MFIWYLEVSYHVCIFMKFYRVYDFTTTFLKFLSENCNIILILYHINEKNIYVYQLQYANSVDIW